ncbi:PPE family protein PPE26 [Mycobacterium branderi]|uniref:PPE family protein PPE26 n=2 Tax=Mycobacterium branderi TaxID=43348 RepID=A0ABN6BCE1_9MYCO|nr:PPE family protein PPE26 [Mycobacterium branderi]
MLDFGALPPEINSARIYAGPGSSSFQAAASAWNSLAAELNSAAAGYDTVVTRLATEEWMGPASTSMANAAAPYVTWMQTTAAQAEQAATQARAAAAAYDQAFAATVPPPLIAANRAQTAQLVATNVLGQNTPAIAQLEAQYGEMWAQDAAAMYGYAGQAAAATKVTPFAAPAQTTNPAGQAIQAAAVTNAAGTASGTSAQSTLSQLQSAVPNALQSLATPTSTASSTATDPFSGIWQLLTGSSTAPTSLSGLLNAYSPFAGFFYNTEGLPYFSIGMANNFVQSAKTLGLIGAQAPAAAGAAAKGAASGLGGLGGLLGGGAGGAGAPAAVSAGLGNAGAVGRLSVPPTWIGGAPLTAPHAPMPISSVAAAPEGGGAGNLLGGMPLAGAGAGHAGGAAPRYGFRPTVMSRPPFAG